MGPFTEKEVKKKGEHSPIYEDNYILKIIGVYL